MTIEVSVVIPNPIQVSCSFPLALVGEECLPATYRNSDSSFIESIEPGEELVGDDITITSPSPGNNDSNGSPVAGYSQTLASNKNAQVPNVNVYPDDSLPPARLRLAKPGVTVVGTKVIVENSLGDSLVSKSPTTKLQANGDVVLEWTKEILPNINHTDSDGSTVSTPAGVPFIATACPVIETLPVPYFACDLRTVHGYSSVLAGDLYSLIASGWFEFWNTFGTPARYMRTEDGNVYNLHAETTNPFGEIHRYTAIDGTPPSSNLTRFDIGDFPVGKEYLLCDWKHRAMFALVNQGCDTLANAFTTVAALNASSYKGYSDWVVIPKDTIIFASLMPNRNIPYFQSGHNWPLRDLISGQIDTFMWTGEIDQSPQTTAWCVNDSGDSVRRALTSSSLHGIYIMRQIQPEDYADFL